MFNQSKLVFRLTFFISAICFASLALAQDGPPPVPVETSLPKVDTVEEVLLATGELKANSSIFITPEVAGRVQTIAFQDGQVVKDGDTLYELSKSLLNAELAQAQARFDNAKTQLDRQETLVQGGSGNISARDDAKAQFNVEKAQLEYIKTRLKQATLIAPFEGVVGLSKVEVGDYVTPGSDMVNFVDINTLKIDFKVPETYLDKIKVGQTIYLQFAGFKDETFQGELKAVAPSIDPRMHAIALRGSIANPQMRLKPGLFTKIKLVVDSRDKALLVPETAVQFSKDGPFVYIINDETAILTPVELGVRTDDYVEITKGIDVNSRIVISGQNRLYNGAKTYPSNS